jgi:hypothetical protein
VEGGGGGGERWREVERGGGRWMEVEGGEVEGGRGGRRWREVEGGGGRWRKAEGGGGRWRAKKDGKSVKIKCLYGAQPLCVPLNKMRFNCEKGGHALFSVTWGRIVH